MAMRVVGRERRKLRIRLRVSGTSERPRLTVFRSARHIYAQVIDDSRNETLASASTLTLEKIEVAAAEPKKALAKRVGESIARALILKGVSSVVFDRNGYLYHGRVQALADGAREAGLKF